MSGDRARKIVGAGLLGALCVTVPGCSSQKAAPPPPPPAQELWGEMKPVVSVKELMRDLLDPLSDNIFEAIGSEVTEKGTVEKMPTTDADWERIRIGATAMAEGASLLKIKRPFAPPGDVNNSVGPEASELSPDEILAKITADPVEWNARIEALRNVGLEALDVVRNRRASELWDLSENLDTACESCHRSYWYPKETPEFYQKLDKRLLEHEQQAGATAKPAQKP